jgi:formate dehydrogenase subunit delta
MSTPETLLRMAGQIAKFFAGQPRANAADEVADHIMKFWDPVMRRQLIEYVAAGGEGVDPLVVAAARKLTTPA